MRLAAILAGVALLVGCTLPPQPTAPAIPTPSPTASPSLSPSPTPSPSPTARPLPTGSVAQVLVDGLNIRVSPARDASAVGVAQAGQRVVIVAGPQRADGLTWYEVRLGREIDGWLAAGSVDEPWLTPVANGGLAVVIHDGQRIGIGLTDAAGQDLQVVEGRPLKMAWSPDGTRLAFLDQREDIWVMAADGRGRHRVGSGPAFAWSPDSRRLAVPDGNRITFRAVDDGQDVGRLALGGLREVRELAWSPDSRWIAFTAARAGGGRDVYAIRADTGDRSRLTRHGRHDTPVWAPSALRLVFNSRAGVTISDPAGDDVRPLAVGRVAAGAWSPDGLFLLLTRYGGIDSLDLRLLGSGTVASDDGSSTVSGGAWSPDGSRILFYRSSKDGHAVEAWMADADGTDAKRVEHAAPPVAWQPAVAVTH